LRIALAEVSPPTERDLAARPSRRLLLYARPEPEAARRMFELAVVALSRAAGAGLLSGWELNGVGTRGSQLPLDLAGGHQLVLVPWSEQPEYAELLRAHDVGVALTGSPGGNPVALEMAAAGVVTITNAYGGHGSEALAARSGNLVVVEPSVGAVLDGIRTALARADAAAERVRSATVDAPKSWPEALDGEPLRRIAELISRCRDGVGTAPSAG
jgi:hypothetical protein